MTYERLEDLLSSHGGEPYSGRNMYGAKCLSVVTENGRSPLKLLAAIVTGCDDVNEAADLIRRAEMDSMGRETVIYWPTIRIPE